MTSRMRIMLVAAVLVLVPCGGGIVAPMAHAHTDVYLSFRADLAPYGTWFQYGDYGWCWRPRHVRAGWRPYVDGHWVLTDAGWTWVAYEPWGWAPYHYGRWFHDAGYGWAWVPGDEWAPAWVSWRSGGDVVGWAPLPPWATWSGGGIAADVWIEPTAFAFVDERYFVAPRLSGFVFPVERNVTVINGTRNITNYRVANDRVVNRSLDPREVERAVGHQIAPRRLEALHAAAPRAVGSRAALAEHGRGRAARTEAQRAAPERYGRGRSHAAAGPQRERRSAMTAGHGGREHNRAATASPAMRHGRTERAAAGRHERVSHGGEHMVRERGPGHAQARHGEPRHVARPAATERRHEMRAAGPAPASRAERHAAGGGRVEHRVQGTAPAVAARSHGPARQASSGGGHAPSRRSGKAPAAAHGQPRQHP